MHLWYGDERCVPLDDDESNHRLATEHLDAPDATWHPVPTHLGCDEAAAEPTREEIADVTLDVAVNGMGPDGHTASLFPGFPQVHADGVCVAVHGSPKPPPDRVTLTLAKLNASHRILLVVSGAGEGADARARDRRPRPRGARLAAGPRRAWRSSPTRRRSMADEVWLLRHAETEWSRTGKHTGRTDIPLTDDGPRGGARAAASACAGQAFALVLCSPLSRARETAQLAGLERSGLRDDLLEWDYGEYEGLTTPEIREERPRLVPVARRRARRRAPPTTSPRAATASSPRCAPPRATSRSSPTATSCARWRRAGSRRRSTSEGACTSGPAPSPCSPTSARSRVISRWNT